MSTSNLQDERNSDHMFDIAMKDLEPFLIDDREFQDVLQKYRHQCVDVDVHIIASDKLNQKLFKAHKLILQARSDYFKVALSDQWVHRDPNGIIIFRKENISPEIFDLLLSYIYTGEVSVTLCNTNYDYVDLIGAADEILLPQLVDSLEKHLIDMYLSELTKSPEVETLLQSNVIRLVSLKKDIPEGLSLVRSRFEEYIRTNSDSIIQKIRIGYANSAMATKYVNALLKVFNKYNHMVQITFEGEAGFVASFDKFCHEFINSNKLCVNSTWSTSYLFAESCDLLAEYCDLFLRRKRKSPIVDIEDAINNIMTIFKYLHDKDSFEKSYSHMLAERLLAQCSISEEAESNMIFRLEKECGLEYTSNMRLMLNNIKSSEDLNNQFKESLDVNDAEQVDFYIFDMKIWPIQSIPSNLIIPSEIERTFQSFKTFYKNKYPSRDPKWLYHLSKGELNANYLETTKVFQVSIYQMSILLQYNKNTSYTFKELQESTGIDEALLKHQLDYLVDARVLSFCRKETKYTLNFKFNSEAFQIILEDPKETKQHKCEQRKRLQLEREYKHRYQIRHAIYTTVKHKRAIEANLLCQEVICRLKHRFVPRVPVIKKEIDSLIEHEVIEFMSGDRRCYKLCPARCQV